MSHLKVCVTIDYPMLIFIHIIVIKKMDVKYKNQYCVCAHMCVRVGACVHMCV